MELEQRYQHLNDYQRQAVDTIDGPVMVVAGPGTGKTELLSVRVARILQRTDTLPENILCLTFTESGATAMRERLTNIIGKDAYKVAIHTFHSFGTEAINQNREYFYNGALFEPADDLARYEILRAIFSDLDYKNVLARTMNGEYTYQSDSAQVITELKRSGLTSDELRAILDQNEVTIDQAERLLIPHIQKIGKATAGALLPSLQSLAEMADTSDTLYEVAPLASVLFESLSAAVNAAETDHPTKPLTAWKKKWTTKDAEGSLVLKARATLPKLRALAGIYDSYLSRMEQAGLYDYDDMILQLVHAMEVYPDLKFNLQEKYLYIMVDEFQDTNLAQMRILHNLTDNPVNEGRPNIMVVGDDDQAIYSFQGADISNILRFQEVYPSAALIPLKDNYRSRARILTEARDVITQGDDRLEQRIDSLDKSLTPHQDGAAVFTLSQIATAPTERSWLTDSIAQQLKQGRRPGDIAVLTRHHREITALLPYFAAANIPISYERQDNALDEPPVKTIELLAQVVVNIAHGDHDDANALLPQLLAHPALAVSPVAMWRLSTDAYDSRKRWLDIMETTPEFVELHTWLIGLAQASLTVPLEVMLDRMIGRPEEGSEQPTSPFYDYYFAPEKLEADPTRYLDHLTALQCIRKHLREYAQTDTPTLDRFVAFIALHRRLDVRIPLTKQVGDDTGSAVHVMTAHKSKGLEFPVVYIPNVIDSVWGEKARSRGRLINYPENLPLAVVGDSSDERLRLFYVAMTRAKHELHLSFSLEDDRGRSTLPASFIATIPSSTIKATDTSQTEHHDAELAWYAPYAQPTKSLHELLAPGLAHYKLSITHLNVFTDLLNGGPQAFLLRNLLHFPSAKTPASSFGSAMHRTLQQAHLHLAQHKERKPLEDILRDFESQLEKERLSEADRLQYTQKGIDCLTAFIEQRYDTFTPDQKSELDFKHQEVYLGEAHLTGMLDVAQINNADKTIAVADYKTGKPVTGTPKTEYEKVKIHKYRQQLLFYKLLVEHSRDYHTYTVTDGRLVFIEPDQKGVISDLPIEYDKEELQRLSDLIAAVWQRIVALDLPDTSGFEPTLKGIIAFEDALINHQI
jgi:DNA helicase II / ATP-dependent DNA helicase PcrA